MAAAVAAAAWRACRRRENSAADPEHGQRVEHHQRQGGRHERALQVRELRRTHSAISVTGAETCGRASGASVLSALEQIVGERRRPRVP